MGATDEVSPAHRVFEQLRALGPEEVLQQALDTVPGGVFSVGPDLRVTSWNHTMEALTGYAADEILGQPCTRLRGDACFATMCAGPGAQCQLFSQGEVHDARCRLRRADGSKLTVLRNGRVLRDADGRVLGAIESALDLSRELELEAEVAALRDAASGRARFPGLVGGHPSMAALCDGIALAADTHASVLISGESGSGKTSVARAIHGAGPRAGGPFVTVDCAELSHSLVGAALFGCVRGAFVGARHDRVGRLSEADGGTLFFSGVDALPLHIQGRLARAIDTGRFERVGENMPRLSDFRVISATQRDLRAMCSAGAFRDELYFRLAVLSNCVPPLRERTSDLPMLVDHFVARLRRGSDRPATRVTVRALDRLAAHAWPGNVRELMQVIEAAYAVCANGAIDVAHLPPLGHSAPSVRRKRGLPDAETVRAALAAEDGHRARAASRLGVSRVTLWKWMRRLGLAE